MAEQGAPDPRRWEAAIRAGHGEAGSTPPIVVDRIVRAALAAADGAVDHGREGKGQIEFLRGVVGIAERERDRALAEREVLRETGERDLQAEREARHLVEDAAIEALAELASLVAACGAVPIKQRERTSDDQVAVEAFTSALIQARALIRRRAPEELRAALSGVQENAAREEHDCTAELKALPNYNVSAGTPAVFLCSCGARYVYVADEAEGAYWERRDA